MKAALPPRIACLTLCFFILIAAHRGQAQIIWQETFTGYATGTKNTARWTTDFGDCDPGDTAPFASDGAFWGVQAGRFRVNDIEGVRCIGQRGDNQNSFTTEIIDISRAGCVDLSVDVSSDGNLECNFFFEPYTDVIPGINGHDQVVVQYQVDGGNWTIFPNNGYFCGSGTGTARAEHISGNTLRIRILLGNQGDEENYYFDNIRVRSNTNTYDIPPFDTTCFNSSAIPLPVAPDGITGSWRGRGVSGNDFAPAVAGPGTHQLTFTPATGQCALSATTSLTVAPQAALNTVEDQTTCSGYILPPIDGPAVPANAAYYTAADGNGTRYLPGDTITSTGQLYIFGGFAGCTDQVSFQVQAAPHAQLHRPARVSACGSYILPPISGTDLRGPTGYSSQPGAQGVILQPGDTIRQTGRYYLFDGSGACFIQDSFSITVRPVPAFIRPAVNAVCDQYPLPALTGRQLSANAGYFTQPGGQGSILLPGDTIKNSQTIFLYDVLDGCEAQDSIDLTVRSTPQINVVPDQEVCDSFLLPPVTGTNLVRPEYFLRRNGLDVQLPENESLQESHQIFIADQNGSCSDTTIFTLTINQVSLELIQTDSIACFGAGSARLEANVLAGVAPFQYDWSTSAAGNEAFAQNLVAGTYTLTVTDQNSCTARVSALVPQPSSVNLGCERLNNVTAPMGHDGRIRVDYSGGRAPYRIHLTGAAADSLFIDTSGTVAFSNLPEGEYQIRLIDGNGCAEDCFVSLEAPPCDLNGQPDVVLPRCSGEANGRITLSPVGGTGPYQYEWSVDSLRGRAVAENLPAGNYGLTVTGSNGCRYDTTISLTDPPPLTLACGYDSTAAVLDIAGGRLPYTIVYDGPEQDTVRVNRISGSVILPNLRPGDYVISVIDGSGCATECRLYLPDPACALSIRVEVIPESCPDTNDGQLILHTTGGVGPVNIAWADRSSDSVRLGVAPGRYSVGVEDALGCRTVESVTLETANATPGYQLNTSGHPVCENGCDTIQLIATGTGPYRADLSITDADKTTVVPIHFSEQLNTGRGQIRVPICLPELALSADSLLYRIISFSDAHCPNDSILSAQAAVVPIDTGRLDTLVCAGASVTIGSEIFDRSRPEGVVVFPGAASGKCDSFLSIALQFRPIDTLYLQPTLCYGDSLVINGTVYDRNRPGGLQRLPQMAANGCDSLLQIEAEFLAEKRDTLSPVLCRTDTILVNGRPYFFGDSQGIETFTDVGSERCDSTVVIDLQFYLPDTIQLDTMLCAGEDLIVGGNHYDQFSPSGIEVLTGQGRYGCDSVVLVKVSFRSLDTTELAQVLCFGDSLIVGTERFDAFRPRGMVVFPRTVAGGCDSTVLIDLTFRESRDTVVGNTICPEDELVINGRIYDMHNPRGVEVLPAGSSNGCDSTIQVQLQFYARDTAVVQGRRCFDQSFTLFGETFTPRRPSGIIRLPAANRYGCDSLIMVDMSFSEVLPRLELPSEIVVHQGDSITLAPEYNFIPITLRWTTDPAVEIPPVLRPVIAPATNMDITLEAGDRAGCTTTASTRIIVDRRLQVYAPNVFRPNSDHDNAGFTIFGGNQIREIESLRIFDRWGNLVFTVRNIPPNEPALGWDGQDMPQGVYLYSATVRLSDGRQERIGGDVLLMHR